MSEVRLARGVSGLEYVPLTDRSADRSQARLYGHACGLVCVPLSGCVNELRHGGMPRQPDGLSYSYTRRFYER